MDACAQRRRGLRRKVYYLVSATVILLSNLSCSVNVLENFADKTSNAALFEDAKILINKGDYDEALVKFEAMKGSYLTDRHILLWKASAYGGKCGLRFFSFVTDFSNIGATRIFPFLVSEFKGGSGLKIDACRAAEDVLESIGSITERNTDENLLLTLISFAKMGNILSLYTDADQDGAADATVDVCLNARAARPATAVAGDFFDDDLREFGTGLTLALANLAAVATKVNFGSGSLDNITSLCSQVPSNFCNTYEPADFTSNDLLGIQTLLKEGSSVGLGVNGCTGDYTTCHCP